MKKLFFALLLLASANLFSQEKPNILWLVCEDMSPYLSCYGDKSAKTPVLDQLAAKGIRFTMAHSNSVQCSPSRSTLISGKYAVSLGTDIHREGRPVPEEFYFPKYLRKAGYYTSNNSKKDYNDRKTPEDVWDISSGKANYFDRPDKSKPFFSIYNCGITHMTRVATVTTDNRTPRTVQMDKVEVPAYIPDLPDVRNDIAWNMDAVMLMDKWVGQRLAELQKSGEADNTIVFFYSDHGGTVPRGKAYVYESGTQIPFIAYFPEKWKHLAGVTQPSVSDRLVSFVDFPETVLNLAGAKIPDFMVGKPFFGPGSQTPENNAKYLFTFRGNQGDSFIPSRAITNGRYKLIWNYQSAYPNGSRQDYQWQMPAQLAWDQANIDGKLDNNPLYKKFWLPVEPLELYDLETDSLETKNLVADKSHSAILSELKTALQAEIRKQKDLGFMPREYRKELQKQGSLYDVVRKNKIDVEKEIVAAETASYKDIANLKTLASYLSSADPVVQYWGASGLDGLAKAGKIKSLPAEALTAFNKASTIPEVKVMLAEAMVYAGKEKEGLNYLVNSLRDKFGPAGAALQNVGNKAKPVTAELQALLNEKAGNRFKFYTRSALINCGVLTLKDLYPEGSKVGE